jgi:hypothetical protein
MGFIRGGYFDFHIVTNDQADAELLHLPAELSPDGGGTVRWVNLVLAATQCRGDRSLDYNMIASWHGFSFRLVRPSLTSVRPNNQHTPASDRGMNGP